MVNECSWGGMAMAAAVSAEHVKKNEECHFHFSFMFTLSLLCV